MSAPAVAAATAVPAPLAGVGLTAALTTAAGVTGAGVSRVLAARAVAPYAVVSCAKGFTKVPEQGGDNHGQMVELFLKGVGAAPGEPWCAAFVHHVGHWALMCPTTGVSAWPLPPTAGCKELGDFAKSHGILSERPVVGAAFLMYFASHGRFAHTGFVYGIEPDGTLLTVEGNTNDDGSRNGWQVLPKRRRLAPAQGHRFAHWMDLLPA